MIVLVPIHLRPAIRWANGHHRHVLGGRQRPEHGGQWAHAVAVGGYVVGVAIVGRPKARALDDGFTAEVTRVATDGSRNACSMLYGAASRAGRAKGYRRMVTYTLATEPGSSLRAAGWVRDDAHGVVEAEQWDRPSRPRQRVLVDDRVRWWAPWSERGGAWTSSRARAPS